MLTQFHPPKISSPRKSEVTEPEDSPAINLLPAFIRLPKSPAQCPLTGLSRSALNELILPCAANGYKPPVKSIVLKKKHAVRGVRLIHVGSLLNYLNSLNGEEVAV
ncbi:hypothetical protein DES53_107304 [Roseimicrobium gellanilyticum]|uniref:Pyocin activator protein PrtN n=1 Tax=Roseimicrobium gellanilyticum TaxID=748857 RepID=A0A366HFY4_9BACT|nr:hypothetical protein DES53_107304 [Roseimicrobium gellanilyticum]